jgi:hypothetical protein
MSQQKEIQNVVREEVDEFTQSAWEVLNKN